MCIRDREGSAVLAPSAYNLGYVKKIQELLGLSVDLMTEPEPVSYTHLDVYKRQK